MIEVPGVRVVTHHVREAARVQPLPPALWLGLRTALATAGPLLLAPVVGATIATWATLAGFTLAILDKGGAYKTRAEAMLAFALGGGAAVFVGTIAQAHVAAQLALITVGTAMCALAQVWGAAATSIGNSVAVQFVVAMALPLAPGAGLLEAAGERVGGFVGGCAWAAALALLFWPVRVYRPSRFAVGRVLRALSAHVAALATGGEADRDGHVRRHRQLRDSLEQARTVLAATRRGRRGETGRGERLLVVVQALDQIFGSLVALEDVLDSASAAARAQMAPLLAGSLASLGETFERLAARVEVEGRLPPLAIARPLDAAPAAAPDPELAHAYALVARLGVAASGVASVIDSLADDREPLPAAPIPLDAPPSHWDQLAAAFDLDSAVLRHAIRVAIVGLASVAVTRGFGLDRGYWVTITAFLLLQPYRAATLTRSIQRIGGTVLGGMIASLLAYVLHEPWLITIAVILLAGVAAAVLQLNYGLYALFLTPTFVLLAEVHARDDHIVHVRVVNTLIGGALAFLAATLLWPTRERAQFADLMARALEAAAEYVASVATAVARGAELPAPDALAARRRLGLALNNAELALERVVTSRPATSQLDAQLTLLLFARRFTAAVTAFGTARLVAQPGALPAELSVLPAFAVAVGDRLRELATAVRTESRPPLHPPADLAPPLPDPLIAARVARIQLQLSILSEAASRAASS